MLYLSKEISLLAGSIVFIVLQLCFHTGGRRRNFCPLLQGLVDGLDFKWDLPKLCLQERMVLRPLAKRAALPLVPAVLWCRRESGSVVISPFLEKVLPAFLVEK